MRREAMKKPTRTAKLEKDLSEAIDDGDDEKATALLSESDPNEIRRILSRRADADGQWTFLMKAASKGQSGVCRALIAAGAAVDNNVGSFTALAAACMATDPQSAAAVVNVLLAANADPNLGDRFRETALIKAARGGLTEVIDVLLNNNADVNLRDNIMHTALYYAANGSHADAVRRLLEAGPDETALQEAVHVAQEKGLSEILSILVGPVEEKEDGDDANYVAPPKDVFKTKVLAELPAGDGRVGFPSDVSLLLLGVGQNFYSSALMAAGFGMAQVIFAGDKELLDGGVRLAPQRRAIMEGMVRLALREWAEGSLPAATSMRSALHAACNAVRQIHVMWATSVLARLRHDTAVEGDLDLNGRNAAEAIATINKATRSADKIRQQARTIAALAATKLSADPAQPADLIRPRV